MKNWSRLVLPIMLGIVAGILHYQVLKRETTLHGYVNLQRDLKPGDRITPDCLGFFELPGDPKRRQETLIAWSDKSVVLGSCVTRELHAGDPLFYRDSTNACLAFSPDQLKKMKMQIHTINLPKELVPSPDDLRVGTLLRFVVKKHDRGFSEDAKRIEPLLITRAGTYSQGQYNPYCVKLAVPCDPETDDMLPWVKWLVSDLDAGGHSFLEIQVREPDASPAASPAANTEEQAADTTSDDSQS